ncbi:anti-sigma factor family protein [Aestuariimicrobium ganziense]|uniref:anti-sigma factor family protein n=1 Tax=Aestuariimicrobium ganziense TaxID=2773677 RepID=UPI00194213BF|nr:zf-HC2 domain-containing protein [Aestuariimicrobium ganziense]
MIRRQSPCTDISADFDALLDESLPDIRLDEVRAHLAECDDCSAALVQHHGLRRILAAAPEPRAPQELCQRLTTIAGESSDRPLWMAGIGRGQLDSPRTRRKVRLATGSVAVLMVSVMVFGLGLVLAPTLPTVADVDAVASLEYDLSVGSGPVAGAVSAVQATSPHLLATTPQVDSPRLVSEIDWRVIDAHAARALLDHASEPTVGYRGVQRVVLGNGADFVVAAVEVSQPLGEPLTVTVLDRQGDPINSGLLSIRGGADQPVLPAGSVSFQQAPGGQISGVVTTVIEAHRSDGSLAARWWIAEALGLVMWSESFDTDQNVVRSAGFTSFAETSGESASSQLRLSLASQTVTGAHGRVCEDGFTCATDLAGLPLIELRADSAKHPMVVCALYGKGDVRVSVLMRRGHLGAQGPGYGLSPDRSVLSWQSGTVVYAVTTNGGPGVAKAVSDELPHEPAVRNTVWQRARMGLERLFG